MRRQVQVNTLDESSRPRGNAGTIYTIFWMIYREGDSPFIISTEELQPVFLHKMTEGAIGDAENVGRFRLHTAAVIEGVLQQRALNPGNIVLHAEAFGKRDICSHFGHARRTSSGCRRTSLRTLGRNFYVKFFRGLKGDRTLDRVFELTDIARPFVSAQRFKRAGVYAQDAATCRARILFEEMIDQKRDVFAPLT